MNRFLFGAVAMLAVFAFIRWGVDRGPDHVDIVSRGKVTSESESAGAAPPERTDGEARALPLVSASGTADEADALSNSSALTADEPASQAPSPSGRPCSEVGTGQAYPAAPSQPTSEAADATGANDGKESCYNTRRLLADAWSIFEVSEHQSVWYSTVPPSNGSMIQKVLLPRICQGSVAFEPAPGSGFELVVVNSTSHARVFVGENWVSDGTIRSPISESAYSRLASLFHGRRKDGVGYGANAARAEFDELLKDGRYNRMAAAREAADRASEELRRAQQGIKGECEQP